MEELDNKSIDIVPDLLKEKKNEELFSTITDITLPQQSPNFVYGVSGWRLNSNGIIDAVGVNLAGSFVPTSVIGVLYGGTGVQTITGIIKGNGTSAFTSITPLAGTYVYYVSDSSGGAVNRKLTFVDGILTSQT
jgi:hypothetical protein